MPMTIMFSKNIRKLPKSNIQQTKEKTQTMNTNLYKTLKFNWNQKTTDLKIVVNNLGLNCLQVLMRAYELKSRRNLDKKRKLKLIDCIFQIFVQYVR